MEYFLIIVLQALGASLHVLQKVVAIRLRKPEFKMKEIFSTFWQEDWNTLFGSAIILLLNLTVHFIINNYAMDIPYQNKNWHLYAFGTAFVAGYAGQRLIYKFLGTAERALNKKIDSIENK